MRTAIKSECTVVGCKQTGWSEFMRHHRKRLHQFCSCGWAGLRWRTHLAWVRSANLAGNHIEINREEQ